MITGASGFIGQNLKEQHAACHEVFAPKRGELDLLDPVAVNDYLRWGAFDVVVHCATERSNRRLGVSSDLFAHNCSMFLNLTRDTELFGRLLFLSSGAAYGRRRPRISEEAFGQVPTDDYGLSKFFCSREVDRMGKVYDLRLFGVFGPHEDWQVRFLGNACARATWDLPVVIRQDVLFDYLSVWDLGKILGCLFAKNLAFKHYNVCSGQGVALTALAKMVVSASGKPLEICVKDSGLGEEFSGDNARLLAEIPGFEFTPLRDSVGKLYQWYAERKQEIDPALLGFDA